MSGSRRVRVVVFGLGVGLVGLVPAPGVAQEVAEDPGPLMLLDDPADVVPPEEWVTDRGPAPVTGTRFVADPNSLAVEPVSDPPVVVRLPVPVSFDAELRGVTPGEFAVADAGSVVRVGAPETDSGFVAPDVVSVEVWDQSLTEKVGAQGLAFELVRQDAKTDGASVLAEIDYSGFAGLYGGDWAQRLRFAWWADCSALILAEKGSCGEPTWLPVRNDVVAQRLVVELPVDRTVKSFERTWIEGETTDPAAPEPAVPDPTVSAIDPAVAGSDPVVEPTAPTDGATAGSLRLGGGFGRSRPVWRAQSGSSGGGVGGLNGGNAGTSGSFAATGLSAAGKWAVSGATGGFSYSYPISLAPAVVGPTPALSLEYSSAGVDGFTSGENTQGGFHGLGWEMSGLGFIERRYWPCGQDGHAGTATAGDMCWPSVAGNLNGFATISLAGHSSELIPTGANNEWRLKDDPFWRVQRCSSISLCNGVVSVANGDNNNEYWVVTTPDGTQYWFGYGQTTSGSTTDAVLYEPVYGDDPNEPCNTAPGYCTQGWRWNLDRVVQHAGSTVNNGNTTNIVWIRETNDYRQASSGPASGFDASYIRGGYPRRIEYGQNSGSTDRIAGRVFFDVTLRCQEQISGGAGAACGTTESSWPDTPLDLDCSGTENCDQESPSFYTKYRLARIMSWTVENAGPSGTWRAVDKTEFAHVLNDSGQPGSGKKLYLSSILRTGNPTVPQSELPSGTGLTGSYLGVDETLPRVVFNYIALQSRADGQTFWIKRLDNIIDELGQNILVTYGQPNPCSPVPSTWYHTKVNCFPVWTSPAGQTAGWAAHHKYVVTRIDQNDLLSLDAVTPTVVTTYAYGFTGTTADETDLWHHDMDPLSPNNSQSYGDWRGYPKVTVTNGATVTETRYFRGMHGDPLPDGTTKTVTVKDSEGGTLTDTVWLNGMVRETRSLASGARVRGSMHAYAQIGPVTASAPSPKYSPRESRYVRETLTEAQIGATTPTRSGTVQAWDSTTGMLTQAWEKGEVTASGADVTSADNRCTLSFYASDSTDHIYVVRDTRLVAAPFSCSTSGTVQSRTLSYYDYNNLTNTPTDLTRGLVTRTQQFIGAAGPYANTYLWYDNFGRPTIVQDPNGNQTTTSYAPAGTGLTTSTAVTNELTWLTTTTLERLRMQPDEVTDPNGKVTDYGYDGLGRTTGVKTPISASYDTAKFEYTLTTNAFGVLSLTPIVRSQQLYASNGSYRDTYRYYNAFGQELETQTAPMPGAAGRTVTATTYNSRGLVATKTGAFHATLDPWSGTVNAGTPPTSHRYTYDAIGRVTKDETLANNVFKWQTLTAYNELTTTVTSPEGRKASTIADVFGRTIQQIQQQTSGSYYATTTLGYSLRDEMVTRTDQDNNVEIYGYDLAGRVTSAYTPDQRNIKYGYDLNGNQTETAYQTSLGASPSYKYLYTTYDALNRPNSRREEDLADPGNPANPGKYLASWVYWNDPGAPAGNRGQLWKLRGYGASSTESATFDSYSITNDTFNNAYQVTSRSYDISNAPPGIQGTYTFGYSYNEAGQPLNTIHPALPGGLAAETLATAYNGATGLPTTLTSNYGGNLVYLLNSTAYTSDGLLSGRRLGRPATVGELELVRSYTYDNDTRRLTQIYAYSETTSTGGALEIQDDNYSYDNDANITGIRDGLSAVAQRQCFDYDHIARLTHAWTQTGATNCTTIAPDNTGPDPYDHTYSYNDLEGGRTGNISQYTNTAHPSGTVTNYNHQYTETTGGGPHAPSGLVSGATTNSYDYTPNGNLDDRTVNGVSADFVYYPDNKLQKVRDTNTGRETRMTYDGNGQRLIRTIDNPGTSNDTRTLYLDGAEITATYTSAGTLTSTTATRYLTHANTTTIGLRDNNGTVHWLLSNHQASTTKSVEANQTTSITQRYEPFGKTRGTTNQLPTDREFLGQTQDDTTNLNYLTNRYYDPNSLHFTTVDPLVTKTHEAYGYAGNNPITLSDPSGLDPRVTL